MIRCGRYPLCALADRLVRHAAVLRGELGPGRLSAAIARGAALGDDEAARFARAEIDRALTAPA